MTINSPENLCNLALSHLGRFGSVNNITTPTTDAELTCALWYDISRQSLLKMTMPNFALARVLVGELVTTIPFGYEFAFEYPNNCLKVLGLGDIEDKGNYRFTVESDEDDNPCILTDDEWEDGLELRYIKDITNINAMSPEFKILFSWYMAGNIALPITQDLAKKNNIDKQLPAMMSMMSGLNAQENPPIRISRSRFRDARSYFVGGNYGKK